MHSVNWRHATTFLCNMTTSALWHLLSPAFSLTLVFYVIFMFPLKFSLSKNKWKLFFAFHNSTFLSFPWDARKAFLAWYNMSYDFITFSCPYLQQYVVFDFIECSTKAKNYVLARTIAVNQDLSLLCLKRKKKNILCGEMLSSSFHYMLSARRRNDRKKM